MIQEEKQEEETGTRVDVLDAREEEEEEEEEEGDDETRGDEEEDATLTE